MSWGFSSTHISTEQKLWRRETSKTRVDSMCAGISVSEESSWLTDQIPEPSHLITLLITKNYLKNWPLETEHCWTYCRRILQCARPRWQMLLDETYEPTASDRSPCLSQAWRKCIFVVMRLKLMLPVSWISFARLLECQLSQSKAGPKYTTA